MFTKGFNCKTSRGYNFAYMWSIKCQLFNYLSCRKLCKCALTEPTRSEVLQVGKEYMRNMKDLIASGRYDQREDFTVVIQPFLMNDDIPRLKSGRGDLSYFAHDCFHFNLKGHNSMATALWKSMVNTINQTRLT